MEPKETNKCKNNVKTSIGICCKLAVDKIWYKIIRQTLILNIVTKSPRTCRCTLSVRDFYIVVTKMTPYTRIGDDVLGSKVTRFLWLWFQIVFCYLCYQFLSYLKFFLSSAAVYAIFFFILGPHSNWCAIPVYQICHTEWSAEQQICYLSYVLFWTAAL